jgi:UDP-N-acetylglucosamine 4-epimerase
MTPYQQLKANLQAAPKTWLITGVAGFIGPNLLETLLKLDQRTATAEAANQVDNVAGGERTTLNDLYRQIHRQLLPRYPQLQSAKPIHRDFRPGDVRHSLADISKAADRLGYAPTQRLSEGLETAIPWYIATA